MRPIDPFEEDVREMLRRRANDIAGAVEHPEPSSLSVEKAQRNAWRSAGLVAVAAAVTVMAGLAIILPRLGNDDSQIVIAGPPDGTTSTSDVPATTDGSPSSNGSVGIHSAPVMIPTGDDLVWDLSIPSADQLPPGTDLATAPVLFSGGQDASNVAAEYLGGRLNEGVFSITWSLAAVPTGSFSIRPEEISEHSAIWRWTGPMGSGIEDGGWIYLRWVGDGWGVVAATTDGVDFSGLAPDKDGFSGEVSATNGNDYYLFAVGDPDTPCVVSDAALTCGEASPHQKASVPTIHVGVGGSSSRAGILRLYEVEDSTLLSITEIAIPGVDYRIPSEPQDPADQHTLDEASLDTLLALDPNRMVFKGDNETALVWEADTWTEIELGEEVEFSWVLDGGSWLWGGSSSFYSLDPRVDNCAVPEGRDLHRHRLLDSSLESLGLVVRSGDEYSLYECETGTETMIERPEDSYDIWSQDSVARPNGVYLTEAYSEGDIEIFFNGREITGDDSAGDYSISRSGNTVAYSAANGWAGHFTDKLVVREPDGDFVGSWVLDQFVYRIWALDDAVVVSTVPIEFMMGEPDTAESYVLIDIESGQIAAISRLSELLFIN